MFTGLETCLVHTSSYFMLQMYQVHFSLNLLHSFQQASGQKICKNAVDAIKFAIPKPESFGFHFPQGEAHTTVTVILEDSDNSAVLSVIQGVEHKGNSISVKLLPLLLGDNEDIIKEEEVHLLFRSSFRKKSSVFYICC